MKRIIILILCCISFGCHAQNAAELKFIEEADTPELLKFIEERAGWKLIEVAPFALVFIKKIA